MKYPVASLAVAAIAISASAANAQEWYHLLDRLGYMYFADGGSITRSGETLDVVFLQGALDSPPPGENVMLSYRVDCAAKTVQLLRGRIFTDDGLEDPAFELPGAPRPVSIDTVSPADYFYDFACMGGLRGTRVEDPFSQIRTGREREHSDASGGY